MPRKPTAWLLCVALAAQTGCAPMPHAPGPDQPNTTGMAKIGVAVAPVEHMEARGPPRLSSKAKGAATGALVGAAPGAALGLVALMPLCTNPITAPACAGVLGTAAILAAAGAIVGGVAGANAAPAGDPATALETTVNDALIEARLEEGVRLYILEHGRQATPLEFIDVGDGAVAAGGGGSDHGALAGQGIDTVLELSEVRIGLTNGGVFNDRLYLEGAARARLIGIANGAILAEQNFRGALSRPATLEEWAAGNGQVFVAALNRGLEELADWIVFELFLLYELPAPVESALTIPDLLRWAQGDSGAGTPAPALDPEYPGTRLCIFCLTGTTLRYLEFVEVDSLQPALRWVAFPGRGDGASVGAVEAGRIANVSYELRLFDSRQESHWVPDTLIYERRQIPGPSHMVDTPLEPCGRYFWTVRARFELDGFARATEWAYTTLGMSPTDPRAATDPRSARHLRQGERPRPEGAYFYPFMAPCEVKAPAVGD